MEEPKQCEVNDEQNDSNEESDNKEKENETSIERTEKNECNGFNCQLNGPIPDCQVETETTTATCCHVVSEEAEVSKNCENNEKSQNHEQRKCQTLRESCQSPLKIKESNSKEPGVRVKRKSRSTRRRLNALMSNSSLHFSDTDSEGELITICNHARSPSPLKFTNHQGPRISVTLEDSENIEKNEFNPNCLTSPTEETVRSRSGSITENLTDIDEIYTSEPEPEQDNEEVAMNGTLATATKENASSTPETETDVEDLSNDETELAEILLPPTKLDHLCEFNRESIVTTEGYGPFSVEIRNKVVLRVDSMSNDDPGAQTSLDAAMMPTTDSEDMEMSDEEEELREASGSRKELLEDLDVLLVASQIVMTNLNKVDGVFSLGAKDGQDDGLIGDCHTDVEDVD